MKRVFLGAFVASALFASGSLATEHRGMMMGHRAGGGMMGAMGMVSPADMSAFMDARIAALHAGLKLNPEQEKLWPPVEDAIRGMAQLHMSHMQTMRETRRSMQDDPLGTLQSMADRMAQGAESLRKLVDAARPLYATLDEAQKRRIPVLIRGMGYRGMMARDARGMMRRWFESGEDDDEE